MIPKFDENGNLPVGIVATDIEEFKNRYVLEFNGSSTRANIFEGYINYCKELNSLDVTTKQWLSGSYTTSKENPNDLDLVNHLDAIKLDEFDQTSQEKFYELHDRNQVKINCMCDVFDPILEYPKQFPDLYLSYIHQLKFWEKYLGKDKSNNSKGIIEIDLTDNESYLME